MAAMSRAALGSLGKGKLVLPGLPLVLFSLGSWHSPLLSCSRSPVEKWRAGLHSVQVVAFCYGHHHNWKNSEKPLFSRYRCLNFYYSFILLHRLINMKLLSRCLLCNLQICLDTASILARLPCDLLSSGSWGFSVFQFWFYYNRLGYLELNGIFPCQKNPLIYKDTVPFCAGNNKHSFIVKCFY